MTRPAVVERVTGWVRRVRSALGVARRAVPITPLGTSVLILGIGAWIVAIRFRWDEAALIATGALLLCLLAAPFLFRRGTFSAALEVSPIRVVAGEPSLGSVTMRNEGKVRSLPQRVELGMGAELVRFEMPSVAAGSAFEQPFFVPTDRRAVIEIGPVTMVKGDPVGLVRRDGVLAESLTVYIQPRRVHLAPVSVGWVRDVDGPTFDNSPRGDIAFHTIREYVPGDDLRHVHWKSTAKTGTMMVRQYVDNRRPELTIVIDENVEAYGHPDEFETALEVAASIELSAFRAGQAVTHHRGRRHNASARVNDLLDDLAGAQLVEHDSLLTATNRAITLDAGATVGVVISGSTVRPGSFMRSAQHLERTMRTVAVRVVPGPTMVKESNTGVSMTVNSLVDFARYWHGVCTR